MISRGSIIAAGTAHQLKAARRQMANPNVPGPAEIEAAASKAGPALAARLDALLSGSGSDFASTWHGKVAGLVPQLRALDAAGRLVPHPGSSAERTIERIVESQNHMLDNRLGTGPANEYALAAILARAFSGTNGG